MTDQEIMMALLGKVKPHIYREVEERLKRGAGSGASSGCADAQRQGISDAEENPQISAVAPGKVKEAARYMEEVAALHEGKVEDLLSQGMKNCAAFHHGVAAGCRTCAVVLPNLLTLPTEPDSEAPEEHSGRRNDRIHQ